MTIMAAEMAPFRKVETSAAVRILEMMRNIRTPTNVPTILPRPPDMAVAADCHGGNRIHFKVQACIGGGHGRHARGIDNSGKAAHQAGDGEDDGFDERDVDARQTRAGFVGAHGVNMLAELRVLHNDMEHNGDGDENNHQIRNFEAPEADAAHGKLAEGIVQRLVYSERAAGAEMVDDGAARALHGQRGNHGGACAPL